MESNVNAQTAEPGTECLNINKYYSTSAKPFQDNITHSGVVKVA